MKCNKCHYVSTTKQSKMTQHLCKIQMHLHYNLMQNVNALACNATVSWNENNCQRSAMLSLLMGVSVKRNVWPRTVQEEETGLYCLKEAGRKDHQWCFLQHYGRISWWLKVFQDYYSARYRGCADLFIMDSNVAIILFSASASSGFWVKLTEFNLADQLVQAFLDTWNCLIWYCKKNKLDTWWNTQAISEPTASFSVECGVQKYNNVDKSREHIYW